MSNDIRKFMDLVEGPDDGTPRDEAGRVSHPDISYDVSPDKVVAQLKSYNSQSYTKLAQKIQRIEELEAETKRLKEEVKQEGRDAVNDLFSADDAVRTRVVETVSFVFTLTKDPKATVTYQYAKIVEALEKKLTPELITVLEGLKKQYQSTTQKAPALSLAAKESVDLSEGVWDNLKAMFAKFKNWVMNWGVKYDQKLDALKAQAAMGEAINSLQAPVVEADGEVGDGRFKSLNDVYPAGNTEVWYAKPDFMKNGMMGFDFCARMGCVPKPENLGETHVLVGKIAETDPETVFEMMQGESWSPMGQARNFIRGLGLSHTSMSVGDVLKINGKFLFADRHGFVDMADGTDVTEDAPYSLDSFQKEYQEHMGESLAEAGYDPYDHVGKDFQVNRSTFKPGVTSVDSRGDQASARNDINTFDDIKAEMISKWKSPEGKNFYVWKKPDGELFILDSQGKQQKKPLDTNDYNKLVSLLQAGYDWQEEKTQELSLEDEDMGDVETVKEYMEPGDEYPLPNTLDDEELFQQIDWAKAVLRARNYSDSETLMACRNYLGELEAEKANRGL